jgi:hypothetical protein
MGGEHSKPWAGPLSVHYIRLGRPPSELRLLAATSTWTVAQTRAAVARQAGVPTETLDLRVRGKLLLRDRDTLACCGIAQSDVLVAESAQWAGRIFIKARGSDELHTLDVRSSWTAAALAYKVHRKLGVPVSALLLDAAIGATGGAGSPGVIHLMAPQWQHATLAQAGLRPDMVVQLDLDENALQAMRVSAHELLSHLDYDHAEGEEPSPRAAAESRAATAEPAAAESRAATGADAGGNCDPWDADGAVQRQHDMGGHICSVASAASVLAEGGALAANGEVNTPTRPKLHLRLGMGTGVTGGAALHRQQHDAAHAPLSPSLLAAASARFGRLDATAASGRRGSAPPTVGLGLRHVGKLPADDAAAPAQTRDIPLLKAAPLDGTQGSTTASVAGPCWGQGPGAYHGVADLSSVAVAAGTQASATVCAPPTNASRRPLQMTAGEARRMSAAPGTQ